MTQDDRFADINELKTRITSLIQREFNAVSNNSIADALTALANTYRQTGSVDNDNDVDAGDGSLSWTGRISRSEVHSVEPQMMWRHDDVAATVTIEATTLEHTSSLLNQIITIGAVLVRLTQQLALDSQVLLRLSFPLESLFVEVKGRIVHQSERGSAVEVSGLSAQDRAVFERLYSEPKYRVLRQFDQQPSSGARDSECIQPQENSSLGADEFLSPEIGDEASFDMFSVASAVNPTSTSFDTMYGGSEKGTGRQRIDLTVPDIKVLESTRHVLKKGRVSREFIGPELPWIIPTEDADRSEALSDDRIYDILLKLSEVGFTGIIEYSAESLKRQLYFDGGYLVEVARQPRLAPEELGPMLQAADRITKRELAMAAAHADEHGLTLERSLVDLDIMDVDKLRHAIAGRLTYLLREVCNLRTGRIALYGHQKLHQDFLPDEPIRVHMAVERVIFSRLYKQLEQCSRREREALTQSDLEAYPEIIARDRDRLERAVSLQKHQRFIDNVLNGRRRLREVFTESGMSAGETFALVYSLKRMGLLRFDRAVHHTIVKERFEQNVTVKYLSVHKASYFEVLNVHWSSYDEIIEKAYQRLKIQFDKSRITDEGRALQPEIEQWVNEINQRIDEAFHTLAERSKRHAYRVRIMPQYKLEHAVPLFLKQSELAERREQWEHAFDSLRRVLEIEPEHIEAQNRMARVRQYIQAEEGATA